MNKTIFTAAVAALVALTATSAVAQTTVNPAPSASFSNTVNGSFADSYTFNLGAESIVAASITNVAIKFGLLPSFGEISNFSATLNGKELFLGSSSQTFNGYTVSTQVLAGSTTLPAGVYKLNVTGLTVGGSASYGGNIVAMPLNGVAPTAAVPEPETYAMLLAGLGIVGFVSSRRSKQ